MAVCALGLFILTRPFVLTPLMAWRLSATLDSSVYIERATWHWPGRVSLESLEKALNAHEAPFVPSVALRGKGVSRTLREITGIVVKRLLVTPDVASPQP